MVNTKKTTNFWIVSSCLSLILILTLYKIVVSGEVKFMQLALVFALSDSVFKEIPSLAKKKYLKPIMITLAILMVGLGIYSDLIS